MLHQPPKTQYSPQFQQHTNPKCITSKQLLSLFSKSQMNKQRLLKQLQQLDIDIVPLQHLTLHQIYNQVQPIMKNTYSIKYLGLNKNEMGIVSRRIDPTKDAQSILNQTPSLTYTINKYFYPKPLKVGRKPPKQQQINVENLQTEIKRSFQVKNSRQSTKSQKLTQSRENPSKKKQIHGSWLSIGKMKQTIYNEKREKLKQVDTNKLDLAQVESVSEVKPVVNSYAKFLNKGIILVKDC